MNRFQLENIYKANGLTDYQLKTTDDLLKVHGVDYKTVTGYKKLDDLNKRLYEKFIVNFYNAFGLDTRLALIPKAIYFAEEITYATRQQDEDGEYFLVIGGELWEIDKTGNKRCISTWIDDDYKGSNKDKTGTKTYLRFEYEREGRDGDEWLHVTGEKEWY